MRMPVEIDQLPAVDPIVLDAVAIEHERSTTVMGRTLRGYGWSPVQVAFAEDRWSWSWMARAVVHERQKRGAGIVAVDVLDKVRAQQADMIQARAEAAWTDEHGEVAPPCPPVAVAAPSAPRTSIRVPPRPLADHLRDPGGREEAAEESQGERL